jgi:hypothetical protein
MSDSAAPREKQQKNACSAIAQVEAGLCKELIYLHLREIPLRDQAAEFWRPISGIKRPNSGTAAEFVRVILAAPKIDRVAFPLPVGSGICLKYGSNVIRFTLRSPTTQHMCRT